MYRHVCVDGEICIHRDETQDRKQSVVNADLVLEPIDVLFCEVHPNGLGVDPLHQDFEAMFATFDVEHFWQHDHVLAASPHHLLLFASSRWCLFCILLNFECFLELLVGNNPFPCIFLGPALYREGVR